MKNQTVHLGFEIPSGKPVEIPVAHLCVTGQTQLSGKTTTLEALISRSGRKAIAFVTKRGEGSFRYNELEFEKKNTWIEPYFRHRADWQFVSDILGAILGRDAFDEVVAKFPQHRRKLSEFRAFRALTRTLNPIVDRVLTYRPKATVARAKRRARKK